MWEFESPEVKGSVYEVPFRYPTAALVGRFQFRRLGGRLECVGVCFETADPRPLSSPLFRAVPWPGGIVAAAQFMLAGPDFYLMGPNVDGGVSFAARVEQARTAEPPRRGRPSLGDDLYSETAQVYRDAWEHHEPDPTGVVARHFGINPTTAARRVVTARRRGYLGRATPRKAGIGALPAPLGAAELDADELAAQSVVPVFDPSMAPAAEAEESD